MAATSKFEKPRGTRDFGPDEMARRRIIEERMRNVFENFGYSEIGTPTFENLELFVAKSGEGIRDELYDFKDKGGRELALRPELTAAVMRFYVNELQREPKPLKLYYLGNCFRYDRPQKGRYREFWQIGCELIGPSNPIAHAELISLACKSLQAAGVQELALRVGNLDVLKPLLKCMGLDGDDAGAAMRFIDKADYKSLTSELESRGVSAGMIKAFMDIITSESLDDAKGALKAFGASDDVMSSFARLEEVLVLMKHFGVENARPDLGIARGLEYYTGLVFEIDAPRLGAEKQLCGGGEYSLVPLFGGDDVPTSGFAIGFDRTLVALDEEKYEFEAAIGPEFYIIPAGNTPDTMQAGIRLASLFRSEGIPAELELMGRSIGKAMKYADKIGAINAIILGSKELESGRVMIKNLKSGEGREFPIDRILDAV